MCDVLLTRRQLLRYAGLVAATFPAARLLEPGWSLAAEAAPGTGVPLHLELVTVSDTQAVITWFTGNPGDLDEFGRPRPVAMPGRVLIGTTPDPSRWMEVGIHEPTPYHYVEIGGLQPGTTYYWRAESAGLPAAPTVVNPDNPLDSSAPPIFTTLVPPPGREIGRVAWLNDLHYGEQVAGLIVSNPDLPGGGVPPGFPVDPADPYWRFMGRGAVDEAKARGCTLLLANGDLTNEAEQAALAECRANLDRFGRLGGVDLLRPGDAPAYFVTRGNHDRTHSGAEYARCSPAGEGQYDCFDDTFTPGFVPGTTHFSVAVGDDRARFRFVGLDSNDGPTTGVLPQAELDYLEAELAKGDATIPLFHHPASDLGNLTIVPPVTGGLAPDDATAFRAVVARHGNTAGVYAGHTHRNQRSLASDTGQVPFFEGGAVKEYPGGYTTVRLFEGGYLVNFWKTSTPEARAWSERSRGEYLGLGPAYQLGGLGDRNWTYGFDARTVVPASPAPSPTASGAAAPARPDAPRGRDGGLLPVTGTEALVAAAALTTVAAGAAGRSLASRSRSLPVEDSAE